MTETPFYPPTQPTANLFPVTAPVPASPVVPNGNQNQSAQEDDEEPYTIKCICIFEDDDGSTVFCEACETWQHIVCYYGEHEVPDVHNCADCEPRPLDIKLATERQRQLREQSESGDRKARRPGSKSQKKKTTKDAAAAATAGSVTTDPQPYNSNTSQDGKSGAGAGVNSSSNKDAPSRSRKSRHRASASTSSLTGAAPDGRKRRSSTAVPPSTMTKPSIASQHPPIPLYSPEFIHLYDHDQVNVNMQGNLFDNLGLAGDLSSWVQNPSALAQVSNGRAPEDVFIHSPHPLDSSQWPSLSKHSTTDPSIEYDGRHPMWKFLKVESPVQKDQIVGEVRGKVGHFQNYCLDPNSRWQELRHPEPFVFFHPQLPIYIDSRREGTQLRYIRRSCQPNVTLKTFITNEVEYHFCFVANKDIPENTEITTMWYLDPQMFPSNSKLIKQDGSNNDGIADSAAICISNVLAHFGGCACDSSQPCLLAKLDLRRSPKSMDANSKQPTNGRRKRNKSKATTSPTSTGPATNSRAGSEAAKQQQEDEDPMDARSTSGSTRGQPRSRDLSPTGPNAPGIGELSAREKRKLAAVEKKFEQLERDQHHPVPKRKKRNTSHSQSSNAAALKSISSGGPLSNTPHLDTAGIGRLPSYSPTKDSPPKMSPQPATTISRQHSKAASPRKKSGSITPRVTSPLVQRAYVDSATQTEPDENDPLYTPTKPIRRHGFVPLTQRLLKRSHEDRLRLGDARGLDNKLNRQMVLDVPVGLTPMASPVKSPPSPACGGDGDGDVEMKDADTAITPTKPHLYSLQTSSATVTETNNDHNHRQSSTTASSTSTISRSLFPLPSTAAHRIPSPRKPSGGLRVQPPSRISLSQQQQPLSSVSMSAAKMSPPSAAPSHSGGGPKPHIPTSEPTSSITGPSPVKKKISLNDYLSRRGSLKTPTTPGATEKAQLSSFLPNATPTTGTSTGGVDGCSPPTQAHSSSSSQPGKPTEVIKQESPATPDGVMKDVQMSPTPHQNDNEIGHGNSSPSSSLQLDPRLPGQGRV